MFFRNATQEHKLAAINVVNNKFDLNFKQNEIDTKKKYIKESLKLLLDQLNNAGNAANYSKLLVDAERLKFEHGESTLFMVNTRENKWLECELKLAEYKCKFIKSMLSYTFLQGNLNYFF